MTFSKLNEKLQLSVLEFIQRLNIQNSLKYNNLLPGAKIGCMGTLKFERVRPGTSP